MPKFIVNAKQLMCYEFVIEAKDKADAEKQLAGVAIDHDTFGYNVNITSWEEPFYLEMTEKLEVTDEK